VREEAFRLADRLRRAGVGATSDLAVAASEALDSVSDARVRFTVWLGAEDAGPGEALVVDAETDERVVRPLDQLVRWLADQVDGGAQ
jgi:histidyl-tRNA synthetase